MKAALIVHFIWILGKPMIMQGTDGLLRGEFASGILSSDSFLDFLPINETAFYRQPSLKARILDCVNKPAKWNFADTVDWFDGVFNNPKGQWIWTPPPCLAKLAVEQMCEVKHIFLLLQHIFVCPSLMTGYWRKSLNKLADTSLMFKAGLCIWEDVMLEPLTVAFVASLISSPPWQVKRLSGLDQWERSVYVLQWQGIGNIRNHIQKFWSRKIGGV